MGRKTNSQKSVEPYRSSSVFCDYEMKNKLIEYLRTNYTEVFHYPVIVHGNRYFSIYKFADKSGEEILEAVIVFKPAAELVCITAEDDVYNINDLSYLFAERVSRNLYPGLGKYPREVNKAAEAICANYWSLPGKNSNTFMYLPINMTGKAICLFFPPNRIPNPDAVRPVTNYARNYRGYHKVELQIQLNAGIV